MTVLRSTSDETAGERRTDPRASIRRHIQVGLLGTLILFAGVGGWAATAAISGAVIASGSLVVDTNLRRIQHPTGGIVADIRVRNGDRVKEGDLLLRLDETVTRANLQLLNSQIREILARLARLQAETSGASEMLVPALLREVAPPDEIEAALAAERNLLQARRAALAGQRSQLVERIEQTRLEITGLRSQIQSNQQQVAFLDRELVGMRDLAERNLVPLTRLLALERERARLDGVTGSYIADQARARTRISETELQIIQLDQDFRREAITEQRNLEQRLAELMDRRVAAQFQLERIELRAPSSGFVHELSVHTIGGVINSSDPVMMIVPEGDALVAEVQVNPVDIDQVTVGQPVRLRFPSLHMNITPEIGGTVRLIPADVSRDQRTGMSFYRVRVSINAGELGKLGPVPLVAGMPVEAFLTIRDRTVISYLFKPLNDQIARTFRAE